MPGKSQPASWALGTLYRFAVPCLISTDAASAQNGLPQDPASSFVAFRNACTARLSAISNPHLRWRHPFPPARLCHQRLPAVQRRPSHTNACFRTNSLTLGYSLVRQTLAVPNLVYPDNWSSLYFCSNAVPATVEMELGLLEQRAWERYNSIGNAAARLAYLQREDISSRVHLFRQRIPIRNVDPLPYQ